MRRFGRALLLLLATGSTVRAGDASPLGPLLDKAASDSWRVRWDAVHDLARVTGDDVFRLRAALLRDKRPRVREAAAYAIFLDPDLGNATLLSLALREDPAASVRRAAARALVHFPRRRAIAALVGALSEERDTRTRLRIVETLRGLTGAPCLLDPDAWQKWWREHEHDAVFRAPDDPPQKGEYEGVPLETKTVAALPGKRRKTPKEPLSFLVLPPFGWTTQVYGPYLLPLRASGSVTWVKLPSVQTLTGKSGYGDDVAVYPVDRLVHALEAYRESQKIRRFLLVGDGASGWIAMRYAQLAPDRCRALILFDTPLDEIAYVQALRRAASRGDPEERYAARTLLHEINVPMNRQTLDRLNAISLMHGFSDPADLEIPDLFTDARAPQGFATIPTLRFSKRFSLKVPALFVYSAGSVTSGHVDAERIQAAFPNAMVAPILNARGMPFIEANDEVFKVIRVFLERAGIAGD